MAIISNGTTIADAGAFSASLGAMVHIKTLTASSSSTLSFVHGSSSVVFDSTYTNYLFKFINIHTSATANFQFNASIDTGSNYNVVKTSTVFTTGHKEDGTSTYNDYDTGQDRAQSTAFQNLSYGITTGNDESLSGNLFLFNPSSTTFVKHFMSTVSLYYSADGAIQTNTAGYFNTTTAIDQVVFKMSSGNIDSGTFKLYGIKDS